MAKLHPLYLTVYLKEQFNFFSIWFSFHFHKTCSTFTVHGVNDKTHSSLQRAECQRLLQAQESHNVEKGLKTYSQQCSESLTVTLEAVLPSEKKGFFCREQQDLSSRKFGSGRWGNKNKRWPNFLIDCLTSNAARCSFSSLKHIVMRHESGCHVLTRGPVEPTDIMNVTLWSVIKAKYADDTTFTVAVECWFSTPRMTDWWCHSLS